MFNPFARLFPSVRSSAIVMVAMTVTVMAGCDKVDLNTRYTSTDRLDRGLVVILPGIEGESGSNRDIRRGLDDAGVPYALAIYRWGFPIPGIGMWVNQTNTAANREAAEELAGRLINYQTQYPDRPIFFIGHSAGGGVSVFTLEALGRAGAKPVEGAFLLSSSISANYPLDAALRMTRRGIVNVHNPEDELLQSGTATFGNVDGGNGPSAGRVGFSRRYPKVFERRITSASTGVSGGPHFIATNAGLIAQRAPAWLNSQTWPPSGVR